MKKLVAVVLGVLLLSVGVYAFSSEVVFVEENVSETKGVVKKADVLKPIKDDEDYISELLSKGYEADWLLDIYDFYLTCGEDISIIESIYTISEEYNINGRNWIETSYNMATAGKHGELGLNDVVMYVSKGVSVEDIESANIICRSGAGTIQEILDRVVQGESIDTISSEIYGTVGTTVENMAKMKKLGFEAEEDLESIEEKLSLKLQESTEKADKNVVLSREIISRYPELSEDKIGKAQKVSEDKGIELDDVLKEYKQTGKYSKYIDR